MKPNAIVYTSNTGYTAEYAYLLGGKTGLPVYALAEAAGQLSEGSSVLYLGWLMAGKVQGYQKAAKRYQIAAVCGVGMGPTGSQIQDLRTANGFPDSLPVFTLQGGFDLARLRGGIQADDDRDEEDGGQGSGGKGEPHPGGGRHAGSADQRRQPGQRGKSLCRPGVARRGVKHGRRSD